MDKSVAADASSYDVGSPASVKNIPGEYLSRGCDSLSDLRGMTGLVAPGVDVGWSEAEPFAVPNLWIRCERCRLPVKPISYCGLGRHEGLALQRTLPFGLQ